MLPAQLLSPTGYFPKMKNPDPGAGETFAQRVRRDLIYRWANVADPCGGVGSRAGLLCLGGSLEDQQWTASQRKR